MRTYSEHFTVSPEACLRFGTNRVRDGWALPRRIDAMIAVLGTLSFLVTLWMLVVVGAAVLEESGAKIAPAPKGKPAPSQTFARVRIRTRSRQQQPMRVKPEWRAAA